MKQVIGAREGIMVDNTDYPNKSYPILVVCSHGGHGFLFKQRQQHRHDFYRTSVGCWKKKGTKQIFKK